MKKVFLIAIVAIFTMTFGSCNEDASDKVYDQQSTDKDPPTGGDKGDD